VDSPAAGPDANARPARTVMFDRASAVNPALGRDVAAIDAQASAADEDRVPELAADQDSSSRPVKVKAKSKPVAKKGRRPSTPAKWGSAGAEQDEDGEADAAPASSKKGLIIGVVAGVVVIVAAIVALSLRGGKKADDTAAVEPAKPAVEPNPAKAEPSAAEEPPALAAKPAPEPAKPTEPAKPVAAGKPAAEKAAPVDKPGRAEKVAADKPARAEKPARDEKAPPAEKAPPTEKLRPAIDDGWAEPKGSGKASEADFKAANDAYQRGNAKLFKGSTADAIKDFNEALRLNPKDPAIHRGLGLAYAQSGNPAEAIKHLKAYLKAAPKANDKAMVEKRIDQLQHAK
jgi:hypothetical protein